ncbi:unnamed protein product, partial [Hymenolepis diminuta]
MGFVSVLIKWMVRSENGGLLNVIFKTKGPSTRQFELAPSADLDFFKNLLTFEPQSLSLLEAIPEEIGGGQKGVKHSHDNPNLEAIPFWLTIFTFLLLNILILITLIRNCYLRGLVNEEEVEEEVNFEKVSGKRNQALRKTLIGTAIFFTLGLICLVILYFSSMSLVIGTLGSNPQDPTTGSDSMPFALFDAL